MAGAAPRSPPVSLTRHLTMASCGRTGQITPYLWGHSGCRVPWHFLIRCSVSTRAQWEARNHFSEGKEIICRKRQGFHHPPPHTHTQISSICSVGPLLVPDTYPWLCLCRSWAVG